MPHAHVPKPKFGWSERVAKEFAEREEKIEALAIVGDPEYFGKQWVLEENGIDPLFHFDTPAQVPTPHQQLEDPFFGVEYEHPHSEWVEWAKAQMEKTVGYRSVRPANFRDSDGNLRFAMVAV